MLAELSTAQKAYSIAEHAGAPVTPLGIDIVPESERLRTQIVDEARRNLQVQELARAQERVMQALAGRLPENEVRAALADRDMLAAALRQRSAPSTEADEVPTSSSPSETDAQSPSSGEEKAQSAAVDLIQKLAELHEAGILTDAEFAAKKAELLSRL